jgi:hypothetical protein
MRSGSEEGSYLRLVDFRITQLWAESNKEEEEDKVTSVRDVGQLGQPLLAARRALHIC